MVPDRPSRTTDEDERLTLLGVVDRLAPRMRAAVVLRYYADLPVRDVAEALGTSAKMTSTKDAFTTWFLERVEAVHGVDLTAPMTEAAVHARRGLGQGRAINLTT